MKESIAENFTPVKINSGTCAQTKGTRCYKQNGILGVFFFFFLYSVFELQIRIIQETVCILGEFEIMLCPYLFTNIYILGVQFIYYNHVHIETMVSVWRPFSPNKGITKTENCTKNNKK